MSRSPSDHRIDGLLLTRVFAGEASAEEIVELERWIGTDPERRELVATFREVWDHTGTTGPTWDPERALVGIKSREVTPTGDDLPFPVRRTIPLAAARRAPVPGSTPTVRPRVRSSRRTHKSSTWRVAAVLAAAALGGALWQWGPHVADLVSGERAVAVNEVSTERGERGRLRLADGTEVVLGPATTIRYRRDFGRRARDIELDGQAYFDVVPNTEKPFIVHTSAGVAEVLGTRFGVHAYGGDATMDVVVAEGRVAVSRDSVASARVTLERGDAARVQADAEPRVERGVNVDGRLAWTEGRLVFDGVPLAEVLRQLGRWYDLDIRIADGQLATQHVTASFANEPAMQVLEFLASASMARIERVGRHITFYSRASTR